MSIKEKTKPNLLNFRVSDELLKDIKAMNIVVSATCRKALETEVAYLKEISKLEKKRKQA